MHLVDQVKSQSSYTVAVRRRLHANPELAFQEHLTSRFIQAELESLGFQVTRGIAGTGLVGTMPGALPGPGFLLRFDMDALPVQEETGLEFASRTPGVMHACGHDGHVAVGLTLARVLAELRGSTPGTFHLLFQPAEEIGQGAKAMLKAGVLEGRAVDYALSAHLWAEKPLGWLGMKAGPVMAGSADIDITVHGKGGHAARPQAARDPILAAAHILTSLQTVAARNLSPMETGVISITRIQAGHTHNVIPSRVEMAGTLRYEEPHVEARLTERVTTISQNIAEALGCSAVVTITPSTIPVVNDPFVAAAARKAANQVDPALDVDEQYATLISEDMAYFLAEIPGMMVLVGAGRSTDGSDFPHHHPRFDIDEDSLPLAAALLLQTCYELAKRTLAQA